VFEDGFEVVATMPKRKDEDKGTDGGDGEGRPSKEAKIGVDAAPLLAAVDIREVMAKEGPLCTVVVLRAGPEKKKEELLLDFTPKKQAVQETLGGQITFMGMWAKRVQCVIIQRIDQEELEANNSAPVNEHKLQPPFHDVDPVRGDLLLMSTDESGEPVNFTLKEYDDFAALDIDPNEVDEDDEDDDEEDDEEDDDEDEEDDGEGDAEDDDGMGDEEGMQALL